MVEESIPKAEESVPKAIFKTKIWRSFSSYFSQNTLIFV